MTKEETIQLLDSLPQGHYICNKERDGKKRIFIFYAMPIDFNEKGNYFQLLGSQAYHEAVQICIDFFGEFTPLTKIRPITINS